MKVEVCVSSVADARTAEQAGADRLELCAELAVGGVTPSPGLMQAVREAVGIPVHVLVRPRSGDFVYDEATFSQMLRDVAYCRELGFEGIATGCLLADARLDQGRMAQLASESRGLHLTFHRAFDRLADWAQALPGLEVLGVDTILSSGQATTALEGLPLLEKIAGQARCGVMPGGGIRPGNAGAFLGKGFEAIHLSALPRTGAATFEGLPLNTPSLLREGKPLQADGSILRAVIEQVKQGEG